MRILLLLAATALAQPESSWNSEETQHFVIHHEKKASSLGDDNKIERIYEAIHPELWRLVPWMTQKKISIYLYGGRDSFLKGRFNPPPWSGGLLNDAAGEKVLAVYEPLDMATTAHELTHLYFHSYFDEKPAQPPSWLDEGLASMLQDQALTLPDFRDKGPALSATIPMKTFLEMRPANDTPSAQVSLWYRQAHSVVQFLKRAHIETGFVDLCGKLRDGEDAEAALREVYGYPNLGAFEQAWMKWRPQQAPGLPVGSPGR